MPPPEAPAELPVKPQPETEPEPLPLFETARPVLLAELAVKPLSSTFM
jgi:hypothetical protein